MRPLDGKAKLTLVAATFALVACSRDRGSKESGTSARTEVEANEDDTPEAAIKLDDDEIAAAIRSELVDDAAVDGSILVNVAGGIVELTGRVSNLMALRAAAEDAQNTFGVRTVENQLQIDSAPRDAAPPRRQG